MSLGGNLADQIGASFKEIIFTRKKKKRGGGAKDINNQLEKKKKEMQKANNHMKEYSPSVIVKVV